MSTALIPVETTPIEENNTPAAPEVLETTPVDAGATPPATIDSTTSQNPDDLPGNPTAVVPYTPNLKFKVMDKELEVPEFLRGVIKDAETEKKVIEILQKAEGLPIAKERLRGERDDYRNKFQAISTQVQKAHVTYQRGDIDGFLDLLKIPHERMLQWAADKVNYSQLPVEQRQVHDQSLQAQRRAAQLEEQNQQYEQQLQDQVSQVKETSLNFELSKPDVKSLMDQFDAQVGKPGAFKEEAINRGRLAWSQRKEDISAEQAVQEVLSVYGKFLNRAQPATPATPAPAANPPQGNATPPKQVTIPNLQGKSSSPVRKGPRSIEELKELGRAAAAASQ